MITVLSEVVYYDLLIYFEFIHFRGLKDLLFAEYETYTSKLDTMNYLLNVMYIGQPYL